MRIGYGQTQRAEKLGVDQATVNRWDKEAPMSGYADAATRDLPTHAIDKRGRPQPLRKEQPAERKPRSASERPEP